MNFLSYIINHKKHFTAILCLITISISLLSGNISYATGTDNEAAYSSPYITSENWPDAPEISANAGILINVNTGTILYEKNCDEKNFPASMTKVMTALLTIENTSLNDTVTYNDEAVFNLEEGASYLALNYGEQLTVEQSLYGLLLASANDVANGLAVYTAGSMDKFVDMMNERAAQIGCTNTHFANPNGLHDDNHYTSCHDMALIMMEAIKNNTFLTINSTEYYEIPPTNKQPERRPLRMLHKMMNPADAYYYKYCVAGKTGYTDEAGTTLVTYCKKDNMELISVVMDSYFTQYDDTIALMNYGFDNFTLYDMSEQNSSSSYNSNQGSLLSSILPSSSSLISVNKNSFVVLPSYEDISTVKSVTSYDNNDSGAIADITYYYQEMKIGSASLKFSADEISSDFDYQNILDYSEQTDKIFSHDNKIMVTYKQLLMYLITIIAGIIFLTIIIIYFSPKNVRRRRAEKAVKDVFIANTIINI